MDLEVVPSTQPHRVHFRHGPFPPDVACECYIFDEITKAELERQRRLTRAMGSVLDDSQVVNVNAVHWYVADHLIRRQMIPVESVGDVVGLGQHGVVQWGVR